MAIAFDKAVKDQSVELQHNKILSPWDVAVFWIYYLSNTWVKYLESDALSPVSSWL